MDMKMRLALLIAAIIAALGMNLASGQASSQAITTACTSSLISSFTPCFNFFTGSTNGGASPTEDCCSALASTITSSAECACLIITGNVPLGLPIIRSLAISLPRFCNSKSVPLHCQATAMTLPAPGPISYGPGLPPLPSSKSNDGSESSDITPDATPTSMPPSSPAPVSSVPAITQSASSPAPVSSVPVTSQSASPSLNQALRPLFQSSSATRLSIGNKWFVLLMIIVMSIISLNRY